MSEEQKLSYAKRFANTVCYNDKEYDSPAVKGFRREEKVRSITRNYKSAKDDLDRVSRGVKPLKPFVNNKD